MSSDVEGYNDFTWDTEVDNTVDGNGEGLFSDASYSLPNFVAILIVAFLVLVVLMMLCTDAPGAPAARNFLGIKKISLTS